MTIEQYIIAINKNNNLIRTANPNVVENCKQRWNIYSKKDLIEFAIEGYRYGIPTSSIEQQLEKGKITIDDFEIYCNRYDIHLARQSDDTWVAVKKLAGSRMRGDGIAPYIAIAELKLL